MARAFTRQRRPRNPVSNLNRSVSKVNKNVAGLQRERSHPEILRGGLNPRASLRASNYSIPVYNVNSSVSKVNKNATGLQQERSHPQIL